MKLGHVHIKVNDLEESVDFYRTLLGLEVRERSGRYVFMSSTSVHHQLALQRVHGSPVETRDRPGLYHVAFEVDDREELEDAYDRAQDLGCDPEPVDHGISESFYLSDPSGNGLEVYRDTRTETGLYDWDKRSKSLTLKGGNTDD